MKTLGEKGVLFYRKYSLILLKKIGHEKIETSPFYVQATLYEKVECPNVRSYYLST